MKFLRRICFYFLVFLVFTSVSFYVFIETRGKQVVEAMLSSILDKPVFVDDVIIRPPHGLVLNRVRIPGMFKAKKIFIQLALPDASQKLLFIKEIRFEEPLFHVVRTQDSRLILGKHVPHRKFKIMPPVIASMPIHVEERSDFLWIQKFKGVFIRDIKISNGNIHLFDLSRGNNINISLEKLILKADTLFYPFKPIRTNFRLSGVLKGKYLPFASKYLVNIEGRADFANRHMKARIKMGSKEKNVGMVVDLRSLYNDMLVKGKISLGKVPLEERLKNYPYSSIERIIIQALQVSGLEMELGFLFRTKMDNFHLNSINLEGIIQYKEVSEEQKDLMRKNLEQLADKLNLPVKSE